MPSLPSTTASLYEDVGALKAIAASIDRKLDEGGREFASIRGEQTRMAVALAQISEGSKNRDESMTRLQEKLESVETDVKHLVSLRNRAGGGILVVSAIGAAAYEWWSVILRLIRVAAGDKG